LKKAEFLMCQGDDRASGDFLLEYQRGILLVLHREGFLDRGQLEECLARLEGQV